MNREAKEQYMSTLKKRYYKGAKTPYYRLIEFEKISKELTLICQSLNPEEFKKIINEKLVEFLKIYQRKSS